MNESATQSMVQEAIGSHWWIALKSDCRVSFADADASWRHSTNEVTNRLLRYDFPTGSAFRKGIMAGRMQSRRR